jgi:hypothetical protein
MVDLISDLNKIQDTEYITDIEGIIDLALRCKIEPHTYLAFYGD